MSESGTTENLIAHYLWVIVAPILIIFGTLGNLSCVAVMCRRSMRSSNASVYLIALALADTLVLYTGLLRHVINEVSDIDIRDSSDLSCRINSWIVYVALDTSVWILVAFTFERILSVFVPHKVKSYCTRMSSVLIVTGVLVLMMAINGHIIYGSRERVRHQRNATTHVCGYISQEYRLFFTNVFPWLDFGIYNCLPFCILIVGNSAIATRVLLSRRKTRKVSALDVAQGPNLPRKNANTKLTFKTSKRTERTSSMTTIMLILNCVFLITTTPVSIYFIVLPKLHIPYTAYNAAVHYLVYTVVNLIMYINNSVNFILYCVTGSRFRKELISIFKKQHTWIVERSGRSGQDVNPSRKSPAVKRQVPATQTSEVPYTVSLFPDDDTVNLTSSVITDKDTINLTSSVITHKDTVNLTSLVITDKDMVNRASLGITDKDTVNLTSLVIADKETANRTSLLITDTDTVNQTSLAITDKDMVNIASPIITDKDMINITSPINTLKNMVKIVSPVNAHEDPVNIISSVITDTDISSPIITDIDTDNIASSEITDMEVIDFCSQGMKGALKITSQVNTDRENCPLQDNIDNDVEAITLPVITDTDSINNTSPSITETGVKISSPVIPHATDIISPELANKETIKTSPGLTDIININNPSRVITDIGNVKVILPVGARVDKASITTTVIRNTDIVNMMPLVLPDMANESSL